MSASIRIGSPTAAPNGEPGSAHVVCEDLFKIYKTAELEVVALRGLDLRVRRGEVLGIVGASGSGKSTLLNILAGLDLPSAGRASVGGHNLLTMAEAELVEYRRRCVGFLWQQTGRNLVPYLNAQHNVELPMILIGVSRTQARRRAAELLEVVGLTTKRRSVPDQLSGGEQQRVGIAVALANDPQLLLADEPTGELDTRTAEAIFELFLALNEQMGLTVIIVTHDATITQRVERVVTIRDGRIATETVWQYEFGSQGERRIVQQEYAVVDRTGRLQLPKGAIEALAIQDRAHVVRRDDHVSVYSPEAEPADSNEGTA